jgi:hypothetical protein
MARSKLDWNPARRGLMLVGLVANLAGCGTEGFVRDSLVEDPGANAFLTQVGKQCGDRNVGTATIAWLLQNQDDVYFVDLTSKLYFGDVSKGKYADDLSAFYPVGDTSRAVECVVQQLPKSPQ